MKLQRTSNFAYPLLPRLIAGGILTVFSIMHFMNPGHFRDILTAAGFPMVDANVYAATAVEFIAGVLLLSGLLTRVGGLLGVATMLLAIYATIQIAGLTTETLPGGLTAIPFVPPVPLPIMVTLLSIATIVLGGGRFSLDHRMTAACNQRDGQTKAAVALS